MLLPQVRRAAARGAADGYCVLAAEQRAGRGRQGRSWEAPPGTALLASVLLRVPGSALPGVPFAAGLATVDAVAETAGVACALKWPNDVIADGRKLAGILVEVAGATAEGRRAVIVGLGLNRTVESFPAGALGVSLHQLVQDPPAIDAVLTAWLGALDARIASLEADGLAAVLSAWRDRATGLGTRVTASGPEGVVSGIAEGVDAQGALLIRTDAGVLHRRLAADVHLSLPAQAAPSRGDAAAPTQQ
jgi:BirA family biotin operon repressor/biotin-[acetyl-CoA-carboxylase] ligase